MNTQNRIESKLAIAGANQEIKLARNIHQIDPAAMWGRFKSGNAERAFLTAKGARDTIDLAAREVNNLAGGPPPDVAEFTSFAEGHWHNEKQGKAKKFYTNTEAKAVLTLAAIEWNALAKAKADSAARAASLAKAKAEAAAASAPPKASSATAPELAGLTGLARATAIHKQKTAAHTPPPAAVAKPAKEAPARESTAPTPELTGLARATAAHQGKAMTPAAPKELTGLARATAAHKAQSDARKK